jgi:hypothetical protein
MTSTVGASNPAAIGFVNTEIRRAISIGERGA